MSRIIRHTAPANRVLIGDRKHDPVAESQAENRLGKLFPLVVVMTHPNGSKQIPIEEVFKIEEEHAHRLAQARQEGFDAGHREGHKKGLAEGLTEARKVTEQFNSAVHDAIGQRESILEEARHNVLDLIMQISRKVTFHAVDIDQEAAAKMVAQVIDQLIDKSHIKIKLNPDHLPMVEQYLDRFLADSVAIKDLTFEADKRVRHGGCFIETPSGDIDARLSSQFDVVEQAIHVDEGDA